MQKRRIVVTSALPYANGDIHIGHLVEYLQTDFWVRFQKMRGHECVYVCADDTHGTPIMIRARQDGITPEQLIEASYARHTKDFADFEIAFDNYYTTHSPENRDLCHTIFKRLQKNNAIFYEDVPQLYCPNDDMFLPDRFVRGTCPHCGAPDQYGDTCEQCGATYSPADMADARCSVCGKAKPEVRNSEHIFFKLELFRNYLAAWLRDHVATDVANKLLEWFGPDARLLPWDISRDAPYFGIEIPGHPGKYFYVWLDAPVGYMASLQNWCIKNNESFDLWWNNPDAELYHFIGKDIVRFHCLFWPAILHASDFKGPDQVFVHGFLTVNGEKMSKSRGTFINARTYLDHLDPAGLRYYYACKINNTTDDVDLNLEDFAQRVNSDLVGKITNLASRGAQMLHKNLGGRMGEMDEKGRLLLEEARARAETIAEHYESRRFSQVPVEVCRIADAANEYFDAAQPWKTVKTDLEATRRTLTNVLNLFRVIAIYLQPILPRYAEKVARLFGEAPYTWASLQTALENRAIAPYEYLAVRIQPEQVAAMVEKSRVAQPRPVETPAPESDPVALKPEIDFAAFDAVDLRVARIDNAETVDGADKLVRLALDLGPLGKRTILSGIRASYPNPAVLNGALIVVVANLKPRKMRFGLSEGMALAAGVDGDQFRIVSPAEGASPGDPVA
ncbi:MAG: methionine--tRNA ligase [Kiritimatiellia bacterium]|jgi:methionyl-tRNA synthetase